MIAKANILIAAKAFSFWITFEALLMVWRGSGPPMPQWMLALLFGGSLCLVMAGLTKIYLRSEQMTMADLGMALTKGSLSRFAVSLLIGIAFFGSFFLIYLWLTSVTIVGVPQLDLVEAAVISFLVFLVLGTMEEIVFRGYFLRKLDTAVGMRAAIYLTSIAFGMYHGWSFDSLLGPAVWGLIYAVLAYWSKGLAIPIGFHVGANFIQGLLSQKESWVSGIWTFNATDAVSPFTPVQVTFGLQIGLAVFAVGLVEYYLRRVHKPKSAAIEGDWDTDRAGLP